MGRYSFIMRALYVLGIKRIRFTGKTYTFRGKNVYVSEAKRIRFEGKTYTFPMPGVFCRLMQGKLDLGLRTSFARNKYLCPLWISNLTQPPTRSI